MTALATSNAMLSDAEFDELRAEAYAQSPTTEVVDLDEAFRWCRDNMLDRNAPALMPQAKKGGRTLVQPRAGVANLEGQRRLNRALEAAGADIIPITIDSMTRTGRFDAAAKAAAASTPERSMLNGYPIVYHGVEN